MLDKKDEQQFSILKQFKSFKYAFDGFKSIIKTEHNFRIQVVSAIVVIIFSIIFRISGFEWCLVFFCIALVMITEILNTAIEKTCDKISVTYDADIKYIKDIAALAVVLATFTALIIALVIFVPKIVVLLL
ncbi:MAG: diacylglycerol kinase family protein [Chitinophagales bacterium]|nr:diacylglycerol kinase family protein [Chitinophagales bacterium]